MLIFVHVPRDLRRALHRAAVAGLRPGGALVLEAHGWEPDPDEGDPGREGPPRQGPARDLLMRLDELREELDGLNLEIGRETGREMAEGSRHRGRKPVVQILGRKGESRP